MNVATAAPRLEVRDVTRSFSGRRVLGPVSFTALPGEVIGFVGENGAGKSTLLNILSGVLRADGGSLALNGESYEPGGYREANERGVFRVYQDSTFIRSLTVEENLLLGWEDRFARPFGMIDARRRRAVAARAVTRLGLAESILGERAHTVAQGTRQLLSVAKVLAAIDILKSENPVILLDEPTTSLDSSAERRLLDVIAELRDSGATILLVSHLLHEVLSATTRVIVLKDGSLSAELESSQTDEAELHQFMVGRERLSNYYAQDSAHEADPDAVLRFEVDRLQLPRFGTEVALSVRAGEIVGVAGLENSGKTELGAALGGAVPATAEIRIDGRPVHYRSIRGAVDAGVVYVPPDRAEFGIVKEASVERNLQYGSLHDRYANRFGVVRARAARTAARELIDTYGVVADGPSQPIGQLSGGNQQKVVLERWLSRSPAVVVLDSPTQGVDTGARAAIYREIRAAARTGAAVVLVSEDMTEVIGLSDRIVVLKAGTVRATIDSPAHAKPDEAEILGHMM